MVDERGWDLDQSPFHSAELALQERAGVHAQIDRQGRRAVRRFLTPQHRAFFPLLPYAFIGSVDAGGQPWASMLTGEPGFLSSPTETTLHVAAAPPPGHPLGGYLRPGMSIAALGIQLPTRRRNRVIGTVAATSPDGFTVQVAHTLGICQKYIQGRELSGGAAAPAGPVRHRRALDDAARSIIRRADTFFVASVDPRPESGLAGGADISHRGGRPGFVQIDDDRTLTTPDFVGNFIFNTLGNLAIEPRAGLLFVDFDGGDLLHLAVRAEVVWDGPDVAAFAGAQRLVRYRVEAVVHAAAALPVRFSAPEMSPLLARTGVWAPGITP